MFVVTISQYSISHVGNAFQDLTPVLKAGLPLLGIIGGPLTDGLERPGHLQARQHDADCVPARTHRGVHGRAPAMQL